MRTIWGNRCQRTISLLFLMIGLLQVASCSLQSNDVLAGSYRLSGGEGLPASISEAVLSIGEKDSGVYIEGYSMPYEFYDEVGAQVVFFDGPAWLTQTENYPVRDLISECHEHGIVTYEFETAPNSFGFN